MKIKVNQRNWEILGMNINVKNMITALDMLRILEEKPASEKDCI